MWWSGLAKYANTILGAFKWNDSAATTTDKQKFTYSDHELCGATTQHYYKKTQAFHINDTHWQQVSAAVSKLLQERIQGGKKNAEIAQAC